VVFLTSAPVLDLQLHLTAKAPLRPSHRDAPEPSLRSIVVGASEFPLRVLGLQGTPLSRADPDMPARLVPRDDETICNASKVAVSDFAFMLDFSALMRSIASHSGGRLEGWGAEVNARGRAP
jgi:hypothetical protein